MKEPKKNYKAATMPIEDALDFVLDQLFADETKVRADKVAGECTYGKLLGALLAAREFVEADLKRWTD